MKLHDWQSQFEAWLADNHSGQDAAHDIFHFRRVDDGAKAEYRCYCRLASGVDRVLLP